MGHRFNSCLKEIWMAPQVILQDIRNIPKNAIFQCYRFAVQKSSLFKVLYITTNAYLCHNYIGIIKWNMSACLYKILDVGAFFCFQIIRHLVSLPHRYTFLFNFQTEYFNLLWGRQLHSIVLLTPYRNAAIMSLISRQLTLNICFTIG